MEFFTSPWYMVAGGALISSPILIHLINRMRFKRIRWAAMEFLLKSQKRNRRRLIIEQLILLLLRILLVLLAGFLVARFLYAGQTTKGATHVVVLDDTMSMADRGKDQGKDVVAFEAGVEQIKQIARTAAQAPSAQMMKVYLLSDLKEPVFDGRLGDKSDEEIAEGVRKGGNRATLRHVSPLEGLQAARGHLNQPGFQGQKVMHFVSDFRDRDWTGSSDSEKLIEEVRGVVEDGINLNLIDVASPFRSASAAAARYNNNLAIIDFKPETRVAIEESPVEFSVQIMNYGTAEGGCDLRVFIDGQEDHGKLQVLRKLPPGRVYEHKFTVAFPRSKASLPVSGGDDRETKERKRRLEREFYRVRVSFGAEQAGLNVDNTRDLVMEVRKRVPTLVVDGNRPELRGPRGDIGPLEALFEASGTFDLEKRSLEELEKTDLDLYPSIVLLNVGEITSPALRKQLKAYVDGGGSLCYFLGEEVRGAHYNDVLFKEGLFPLKMLEQPFDPVFAEGERDPVKRKAARVDRRTKDRQLKILLPKPENPLVAGLKRFEPFFRYLSVDVYWKAQPRSQWDPDGRQTEALIVLPNTGSIQRFQSRAQDLSRTALERTQELAAKEKEYQRYEAAVQKHRAGVRVALESRQLFDLGQALQTLLSDASDKMADLWAHESMRPLAAEIREFREQVLFGDPLLVSRPQGRGRTVAVLTPAGTAPRRGVGGEELVPWNNWAEGEKVVSASYAVFLRDLQTYLIAQGQTPNRTVGEAVEPVRLEKKRYEKEYTWRFLPQPDLDRAPDDRKEEDPKPEKAELAEDGDAWVLTIPPQRRPGVYRLELTLTGEGKREERREVRAIAFNVDASAESDLKRADRDRLLPTFPGKDSRRGKLLLRSPGDTFEEYKERQPDASESPWLYLFFILILVVEQAMAVHLSHHLKGGEQAPAAPAAGPQPAAA